MSGLQYWRILVRMACLSTNSVVTCSSYASCLYALFSNAEQLCMGFLVMHEASCPLVLCLLKKLWPVRVEWQQSSEHFNHIIHVVGTSMSITVAYKECLPVIPLSKQCGLGHHAFIFCSKQIEMWLDPDLWHWGRSAPIILEKVWE